MKQSKKIVIPDFRWLTYKPTTLFGWLLPPLILGCITFIFYYPSLNYNFQFDDIANIKKYYSIRLGSLQNLFFVNPRWISFWLNSIIYSFVEFKPFLYRLINVLFHISGGILVFFIINNALARRKDVNFFTQNTYYIALMTAGLYMLHPVQTQTVSYVIQGQLEGLAGLCILILTYLFLKLTQATTPITYTFYTIALFAIASFSCGTKEIAIVSPFLLFLTDWFFVAQGDKENIKKRWKIHVIISLIVWGTYLYFLSPTFFGNLFSLNMVAHNNIGNILTHDPKEKILPLHYFISQFKVILHYIYMYIWPFNICVEYDWKLVKSFFSPDCLLPLFILLSIFSYIIFLLAKDRINIIAFASLWFFIVIAPRSSIIPSSELLTDYKTYCASFAILFLLASGILTLLQNIVFIFSRYFLLRPTIKMQQALCFTLLLPVGYAAYERNTVWRSGLDFWGNIIKNAPEKARAYNNYAVALSELKKFEEAIPFYKKAIKMDEKYPDPWNNIAVSYSVLGQLDLAIAALRQSLKIQPHYPEGYNNLATFLMQKQQYDQADKMLDVALKLRTTYGKALFNKGKIRMEQGQLEEAFPYFKKACLEADLDNEPGFKIYANVSLKLQKADDAILAYKRLLQYNPQASDYHFGLGNAFYLAERFKEAIESYKKTVHFASKNERAWYNLGETYLKDSNPTQALNCFTKTLELNPTLLNAQVRVATCYNELGQTQKGCKILQTLLEKQNITADIRRQIEETLTMFQQRT